jgi:hypothetical protein
MLRPLLVFAVNERRLVTVRLLSLGECLLLVDMRFEPVDEGVTFGKTPFGLIRIRVAKTIGVDEPRVFGNMPAG